MRTNQRRRTARPLGEHAGAEGWISRMAGADGNSFTRADVVTHVRDEHSTFAWILEGLIERTGFRILSAEKEDPAYADYLCVKA